MKNDHNFSVMTAMITAGQHRVTVTQYPWTDKESSQEFITNDMTLVDDIDEMLSHQGREDDLMNANSFPELRKLLIERAHESEILNETK
jgi:hypothetical protein